MLDDLQPRGVEEAGHGLQRLGRLGRFASIRKQEGGRRQETGRMDCVGAIIALEPVMKCADKYRRVAGKAGLCLDLPAFRRRRGDMDSAAHIFERHDDDLAAELHPVMQRTPLGRLEQHLKIAIS